MCKILYLAVIVIVGLVSQSDASDASKTINYRLPDTVEPTNYDIYLHPYIESGTFTGQVNITIKVLKATDTITLNSLDLTIGWTSLLDQNQDAIALKGTSFNLKSQFLIIELTKTIQPREELLLGITFNGKINEQFNGLFKSSYYKSDDTVKTIATTIFSPTNARKAFPCFDEPNKKATFQVTLVHPNEGGYHAFSNMNIESEVKMDKYTEVHFKKSVPMSTYLLCFTIADYTSKTKMVNTHGIGEPFPISVYASPENIHLVDYALNLGARVTAFYIDYFKIEYPLPKLDMIAVPDITNNAMEHWGLISFQESTIFANSASVKTVIAHEIAHMWFGNLVTMYWWNDLWLSEGFATHLANKAKGGGDTAGDYIITIQTAFDADATLASHPVVKNAESPGEIAGLFDTITYSKGASLVRMLEHFLKPEVFRTGVTNYLNKFKYKNTVTEDFLRAMQDIASIDVIEIMRTWTEQMGFPVVSVKRVSDTEYKLTQRRFLLNKNEYDDVAEETPFDYKWSIPITYTTSADSTERLEWFYHPQDEITITLPSNVDWIKFNKEQVGYYRVNYQKEMWDDLSNALIAAPKTFHIYDRASLLNDVFALADSAQLPYSIALDMTKYLSKEDNYVVWEIAAKKLTAVQRILMSTDTSTSYAAYAQSLVEPLFLRLGWASQQGRDSSPLQSVARLTACSLGVPKCLEEASAEFKKWLDNVKVRPHPIVRGLVYTYGMKQEGTKEIWERVWNLFVNEKDPSEKSELMDSLAAVNDANILSKFVDRIWNEESVRGEIYLICLYKISLNPLGESIVWNYVKNNWSRLVDLYGINDSLLGAFIPVITENFATKKRITEMQDLFEAYPEAGAGKDGREKALSKVRENIVWLKESKNEIDKWLKLRKTE